MKKNTYLSIGIILILLVTITIITINSKNAYAKNIENQAPVYQIGDVVADFSLKNTDGNIVSLSANTNVPGYILVFTCNHCPYAKAYENRILELNKKYKPLGYPVIAINSNIVGPLGEESPDENKIMANDKGFTFSYLKDDAQEVAMAFGAKRTPTAFVLKRENGKFILKYGGAIDNNSQSAEDAKIKYVEQAIGELLIGKTVSITTTKSIGCGIKWKNS